MLWTLTEPPPPLPLSVLVDAVTVLLAADSLPAPSVAVTEKS